jgi:penicillin amidase
MHTRPSHPLRCALLVALTSLLGAGHGCAPGDDAQPYQPDQDAEVIVDRMGIPHIYAASDADALFASGYMMARMRPLQLELVRRQAQGRLAELLGPGRLRSDLASRALNFPALGRENRARLLRERPADARLLDAFVSGINRYFLQVRQGEEPRPAGFRPEELDTLPELWTRDDPYIVGKLLSFGMSSSLDYEILATAMMRLAPRLFADLPLSMPTRPAFIVPREGRPAPMGDQTGQMTQDAPPPPSFEVDQALRREALAALARYERLVPEVGSNNWAVSGKHTEDGRPLLAGDPHQPLSVPLRFFAQHIDSQSLGGTLDVIGFAFAGAPGVQLGHNRRVAWTATTNFADVMDFWDVSFTEDGEAVLLGTTPRPARARKEVIRVRQPGQRVAEAEPREASFTDVPGVGVLLPEELLPVPRAILAKGEVLLAWTGFSPSAEASTYLGLARAQDLTAWDEAARTLEVGAVNLIGADAAAIRYRVHALVPDRGDPRARPLPFHILDGKDGRTAWTGAMLGEDRLPASAEPAQGFLSSANNDPWGFTADGHPERAPFYYGYFYDPGDRAARIEGRLRELVARGKVRREDMVALQNDAYITAAEDLLPALQLALSQIDTDPALRAYRGRQDLRDLGERLRRWDRQMRRASPDAVAFFAFMHFAARRALEPALGAALYTLFAAEPSYPVKFLRFAVLGSYPGAEALLAQGKNEVLVGGLADAAAWLGRRFGGIEATRYAWRDVHGARFDHPLGGAYSLGVVPVDGSIGTVNVSATTMFDGQGAALDRFSADDGPLYRMVVGFGADGAPQALLNFPAGNDADPQGRHYRDQMEAWQEGRPAPLPFRRAEVEAVAEARLRIPR